MSTETAAAGKHSGHDRSTAYDDHDTIYITGGSNGSVGVFHATADCWSLKKAASVREKTYRTRPIRSDPCQFCHDEGDGGDGE